MKPWVNIHTHTHFSLMDGTATPAEYAQRAVAINMPAIAITDHGTLSGHREFAREMQAVGVKPMLGVEAYITADRTDKRSKADRTTPLDLIYNHIVIVAKDDTGLENLNRLNEIAWTEGFFQKPRIDFEALERFREGLIVSSACPSGLLAKAIEHDELAIAKSHLRWFKERFGDDFYVEIMPHTEGKINHALIELADAHDIKIITSTDCHHSTIDQKPIQEIMLILNTHAKLQKGVRYEEAAKIKDPMSRLDYLYGSDRQMTFRNFDIHLCSYDEQNAGLLKQGIDRPDLFSNTLEIAEKVGDYSMPTGLNLLPADHKDPDSRLESLAVSGLKTRELYHSPVYRERLFEELDIIKAKQFSSYFLVVRNMINWSKKNGIMVGPGRGSSAGSLVCYALGITEIDPIEHNLLFFRFINPDRNDFPDIDTDIQDSRRDEVKQYLERQYKNVASIATFLEFKDKGIVRDVSRALHVPLADVNKVLKLVDTWDEFISNPSTLEFRNKYPDVVTFGEQLRGRIRGTGIHAAGVVTSREPIFKYAPMETRSVPGQDGRMPVVAVDMEEAANIGLIKIDALGLKTLTVISDTLEVIEQRTGKRPDLNALEKDDRRVYQSLSDGNTKGVFQCEATPYTNLIIKMGVRNFDELVASNALVRPGAMNTIGKDYIARKRGKQEIRFVHPSMVEFTKDTYGCIIYQEQVMQACTTLGGMSMVEADKVRKIIGKKKDAKEFDQFKDKFINHASTIIQKDAAASLWHDFEAHAGYSFNKSHAVAYSTLSYWTAWLKEYYPLEFMYALLKNEADKDKRTEYLIEAKRIGLSIRLPHINESGKDFAIEGSGIRFGLTSIKYISDKIADRYIEQRPFSSYAELESFTFTKGSGVNSRALAALNAVGGATFADNPRDPDRVRENLYEYLNLPEFKQDLPQHFYAYMTSAEEYEESGVHIVMGVAKKIKRGKGWSRVEFMDRTGTMGIFDDENTKIETGKTYVLMVGANRIMDFVEASEAATSNKPFVKFLNYRMLPFGPGEFFVLGFKPRVTKAGKRMATMTIADSGREMENVVVFPTVFAKAYMGCEPGSIVKLKLGRTREGSLSLQEVL